jgi:hypothetical protein
LDWMRRALGRASAAPCRATWTLICAMVMAGVARRLVLDWWSDWTRVRRGRRGKA